MINVIRTIVARLIGEAQDFSELDRLHRAISLNVEYGYTVEA